MLAEAEAKEKGVALLVPTLRDTASPEKNKSANIRSSAALEKSAETKNEKRL